MKLDAAFKRIVFSTISLLVIISSIGAASVAFTIDVNQNDVVTFQTTSPDGRVFDLVELGGDYSLEGNSGEPLLPARTIFLAVPSGARFVSIRQRRIDKRVIEGEFSIFPSQPPVPTNGSTRPFVELDPAIAQSQYPFPGESIELVDSSASIRGYRFFVFRYHPLQWTPNDGKLELARSAEFEVTYRETGSVQNDFPESEAFFEIARDIAINPSDISPFSRKRPCDVASPRYLIITSNALADYFQPLADWKTRKGVPATIVTVESIESAYTGDDTQAKIKNCIFDYVIGYGTEFVLLGGDNTVVPKYDCYCTVNGDDPPNDPNWHLPTDLYYCAFDGSPFTDWNMDGDENPCETIGDGVDIYPDIFLSRVGVRSPAGVQSFVNKTLRYEENPPLFDFAHKLLVSGAQLWGAVGSVSDAEAKSEGMVSSFIEPYWDATITRIYDTSSGIDLTPSLLWAYINMGYGVFHIATHGGATSWGMESGGSYNSDDASTQTNQNEQGIIATIACNTNAFDDDTDPCLSEAFLRNPNGGATAYFGSSRYGWGTGGGTAVHGPSFQYNDEFFRRLLQGGVYRFGRLVTETKIAKGGDAVDYGSMRWLQFTLNPLGDPELNIRTEDPISISATHPSAIDVGASFTVSTTPSGIDVCCWMESAGYYVVGSSPFTFTAPSSEGTILVTATTRNCVPYEGEIAVEDIHSPRQTTLVAPFDDAVIGQGASSLKPTLLWEVPLDPNGDSLDFRVQWNDSPDFATPLGSSESRYGNPGFFGEPYPVAEGSSDTIGFTFRAPLEQGQTYWWRVSPYDGSHYGSWSELRCFTVDTTRPTIEWGQTVTEQFRKSTMRAGVSLAGDALSADEVPSSADQYNTPIIDPSFETLSNWTYYESHTAGSFSHGQSADHVFDGTSSYRFSVGSSGLFGGDYQQLSQTVDLTLFDALYFSVFADGDNDNDHLWARLYVGGDRVFNHQIVTSALDEPDQKIDISGYDGAQMLTFMHYVNALHLGARKDCYFDNLRLGWTIISNPILFDWPMDALYWDRLKWTESGSGSDFRVTVQHVEENRWVDVAGLADLDFDPAGHDISILGREDSIRLVGRFDCDGGAPTVGEWSLSFAYNPSAAPEAALPADYSLRVYPNPFNSAVRISVGAGLAPSRIEIFDINGRMVDEISANSVGSRHASTAGDAGVAPTVREYIWQPDKSLGSGVFFVRVSSSDKSITKRVVYLK
ncbi:T9SS type A sorting domain-containing protein [bacterium]|nr:T9SS type A sorting domain-containing protein [bacterium]